MAIGSPQWMYKSGEAYELEQSLKTNDGDSSYLSWTPASAGNQRTWTWSAWVKRGELGSVNTIFGAGNGGTIFDEIRFDASDRLEWFTYASSVNGKRVSTAVFRDVSAWYHIIAVYDSTDSTEANRMKLYVNGEQLTSFSSTTHPSQNHQANINNNIIHAVGAVYAGQLYNPYDGYLSEVNFIDGQALTPADFGETGDYGEWKPIEYSGTYGTNGFYLPFKQDYTVEGFSAITYKGNSANRYLGGFGFKPGFVWQKTRDYGYGHQIVDAVRGSENEFYEISNATSGKEATTTNGLTGFKTDGVTLGTGNGWNNSARTQVMWAWDMGSDTPTGFGAVAYKGGGARHQVDGFGFAPSLVWIKDRDGAESHSINDIVRGTQKRLQSNGTDAENAGGITKFNPDGFTTSTGYGSDGDGSGHNFIAWGWDMGGTTATNTSGTISSQVRANPTYGQSIVTYDGNGTNNATVGHGLSFAPELVMIKRTDTTSNWNVGANVIGWANHLYLNTTSTQLNGYNPITGQASTLEISADSDVNNSSGSYVAYCFHNVSGYSKISSYTGNGSTNGPTVTLGFRPAFIMLKSSTQAENWNIIDNVRSPFDKYSNGANLRNVLKANSSVAESQFGIKFTDTGFQLVTTDGECNANGQTYIYMAFAGGLDSIADHNTTGTIPSYVKANPTYGQSVVSYIGNNTAGATVGHGLSSAPEMMIVKNRELNSDWIVYHSALGNTKHLRMNLTNGEYTSTLRWNDTSPTSSVFTLGSDSSVSENNDKCIAYCFHSVTGYSKIGSYTGNASTNALTFGFKPAFMMIKKSSASGNSWIILDTLRDTFGKYLEANNSNVEGSASYGNVTDTGFTMTNSFGATNASGATYIYMAFADKREYAYWLDQSGNNNDWTSNNLTESDISVDSPTNNFATLNPLGSPSQSGVIGYSEGNLRAVHSGTNLNSSSVATIGLPNSGKYYWEVNIVEGDSHYVGVAHNWHLKQNNNDWIFAQGGWSYRYNGAKYSDGTANSYGDAYDDGDIVGVAVDIDNSKIYFSKNGVWQNSSNPATSTNPAFTNVSGDNLTVNFGEGSSNTHEYIANFGQDSSFAGKKTAQGNQDGNDIGDFYYTPPTGFLALCSKNLPDVAVVPSEHFNTVLWTGDGQSSKAITNTFQPDFTWIKGRDTGSDRHNLYDAIRGATHSLSTDGTDAVITRSTGLTAFTSTGFTVGNHVYVNRNTSSYVSWNWKLNGSGSSNTDGDITSTVSANQDIGVSVLTYTGNGSNSTVGHGLAKPPEHILTKRLDAAASWMSYSEAFGPTKTSAFNVGENYYTSSNVYNNTAPTSSVFTIGENAVINTNNGNYVAYCFHSVDGVSRVGEYTGNSNADGPFVYLGFKPAFILLRNGSRTSMTWYMIDNKMGNPENYGSTANKFMQARRTNAEDSPTGLDFLSNGFKIRTTGTGQNYNGETMIYIAFAETPFKNSNAK